MQDTKKAVKLGVTGLSFDGLNYRIPTVIGNDNYSYMFDTAS